MTLHCWHYEIDTLPHLSPPLTGEKPRRKQERILRIPFGVWSDEPRTAARPAPVLNLMVDVQLDGQKVRLGFDTKDPRGFVRSITSRLISFERMANARSARWYLDMVSGLGRGNQYFEAILWRVPAGSRIQYTITITTFPVGPVTDPRIHTLGPYTFHAVDPPEFAQKDAFFASDGNAGPGPACVLYCSSDALYHYIRADFDDISTTRLPFDLQIDGMSISLATTPFIPESLVSLPHIDPFADTVVAVIPKKDIRQVTNLSWHGHSLDVYRPTNVGRARVMFIHYCMQGLNDLFEAPNAHYDPPRTYMQTTMRDEYGTYSSRPQSAENDIGDGYLYTLEAHRKYGIKHMWTFNGGLLALMKHDCASDLQDVIEDIESKPQLLEATIAGFGGHRLPYYQEETNTYSIELGTAMMKNLLRSFNDVYYLDQRFYKQIPNVMNALVSRQIKYIVIDERTGFDPYEGSKKPNGNVSSRAFLDGQYLWQDAKTGLYLLFITNEMKEHMVGSSPDETARGKLARPLRQKLLYFAANPVVREKNLLIYSDDADKASGNGWFDGNYDESRRRNTEVYAAALEWIAAHPWIEVVISADLDPQKDCVGTINMETAIDPVLDPGGVTSIDCYGKALHFDAWYDCWKTFDARWLGKKFEAISHEAEYAIIDWEPKYKHENELYELAKMNFAMALHESQWNKQPLEDVNGKNPNRRRDVLEPEDFVIAATLQIRNTHVYLAASAWASWAQSVGQDAGTYANDGPLIRMLEEVKYADQGRSDNLAGKRIFPDPLCLDHDLLRNVVLYNRDVLVVIDQNGGRVTHLFVMQSGKAGERQRAVCVSGTPKAWQFLTGNPTDVASYPCDGEVFQNTVYTPNHAFIACDVKQAEGTLGTKHNPKSSLKEGERELVCWYPDNFNAYDILKVRDNFAELHYRQTLPSVPMNLETFRSLLEINRVEKRAGRSGVIFHRFPPFSKRISLDQRRITIEYDGTAADHIVANELCGDVYRALLFGDANQRHAPSRSSVTILNLEGATVTLTLGDNCAFTASTREGDKNRRLHRVMTDCIEITSMAPGAFSYHLDV